MPKFPDRWFDYSNVGDVISGTRMLAFKVPLKQNFFDHNNQIPDDSRFTPDTLLDTLSERGLKLGLVIDLTFTDRYYDPEQFTSRGVQYQKIFVPGRVIPDQHIIDTFCEAVGSFLSNSEEDSLVGVHCTHGVNRTGYVVCRYMVEHLGMKATEALAAYGEARGYPVERVNYIHDLKCRAGEIVGEHGDAGHGQGHQHTARDHQHKPQKGRSNGQQKGGRGQISEQQGHHEGHHGHASGYRGQHEGHQGHHGYPPRQWGDGAYGNQHGEYSTWYNQQQLPYYRNSHEEYYNSYRQPYSASGNNYNGQFWNDNGQAWGHGFWGQEYAPHIQSSESSAGSYQSYSGQNSQQRRGSRGQGNSKHF